MNYKRGDVILVRFPNSNLTTYKKRPALIVQNDGLNTSLPQTIVAMITTNLSRTGPTRVSIKKSDPIGQKMGLLSDSVVVTDNLATVSDREIDRAIGNCQAMQQINQALKNTLGIP
ncbi:MAG: type II toxin-antitoxin system PemK/MazF family toxin [Magnetococcales bacterium]|nr:type II toxin-antitoxin system PemK/MazF family toxin [Magnetococcales bacterium]